MEELTADARLEVPTDEEENSGQEEKENSADSPSEETEEEEGSPHQEPESEVEGEPSDADEDKNIPFHKHPRWKQRQKEIEELRRENEELKAKKQPEATPQSQAQEDIPDPEFVRLFGDNPEAYKLYSRLREKERHQFKEDVLNEIRQERTKEQEAIKQQETWINTQLDTLHEEGYDFDDNKLLKVIDEYQPTDRHGNFDFRKGMEIYELKYPKREKINPAPKKKVAAKAAGQDTESDTSAPYKAVV